MARSGAVKAGEAFVEIFSDDGPLQRGLKQLGGKVDAYAKKWTDVGSKVAGVGAAVAGVGAVGAGLLSWPLKLAANLEQTSAAFTTLLKDEAKAKSLISELQQFAASTPFQFPELAEASQKLIAFGSEAGNVQSELRRIGDISAGIGAPIGEIAEIYGKARVQGRLFAEDINQLTGRGIPIIQELAKQFGVTDQEVKGLVKDGKIGFANLEKAFVSLTSQGGKFAGGMERQSKTLIGSFSTLKDNLEAAFRPFGEAILPAAKAVLNVATKIVQRFGDWAERNKGIAIAVAGISAGLLGVGAAVTVIGTGLAGVGFALGGISTALGIVSSAVAVIASPVTAVAAGVLAIGAAVAYVANEAGLLAPAFDFLRASFGRVFATFQKTFGGIINALQGGKFKLAAEIAWSGVKLATLQGTQQVLRGIEYLWDNAGSITAKFFNGLITVVAKVFKSIPRIAIAALRGGSAISDALKTTLAGVFSGGIDLASGLDPAIARARQQLGSRLSAANRPQRRQAPNLVPPQLQARAGGFRPSAQLAAAPLPSAGPRPAAAAGGPSGGGEFGQLVALTRRQVQLLGQIASQGGLA